MNMRITDPDVWAFCKVEFIYRFLGSWLTGEKEMVIKDWLLLYSLLLLLQSCPTLCDPIDSSPPGSTVPGILQARTLEWVAISFFNAWKWKVKVKSLSRVQLCDLMDCSLPGTSVHGVFQARVLEWSAIAFLQGSYFVHFMHNETDSERPSNFLKSQVSE